MKKFITILAALVTSFASADLTHAQTSLVPRLDHVFVIMMENRSYHQIIGNPNAPFINQMAHSGNLASNYFAIGHPSLTNYLELIGGSNFGIVNDKSPDWHRANPSPHLNEPISGTGMSVATPATTAPFHIAIPATRYEGRSITDQMVAANLSWKSYQESLPAAGANDVNYSDGHFTNLSGIAPNSIQKLYVSKHNPFVYFANVQANTDSRNGLGNIVAFDGDKGLYADLKNGTVPNFSFIAPDQCHDMHGASGGSIQCTRETDLVRMGDATVRKLVRAIKQSRIWGSGKNAIILVWDENDFAKDANQVVAIVDTNYGVHGVNSNTPYSHFSLLRTLEAAFGLPCLNHACDAIVMIMVDLFQDNAHHDLAPPR